MPKKDHQRVIRDMDDDLDVPVVADATPGVAAHFRNAVFGLVTNYESTVPVRVVLGFTTRDPHAVEFSFGHEGSPWVFARQLLAAGLVADAGEGDVRVWPSPCGGDITLVELKAPGGHALFQAATEELEDFLAGSYDIVPRGDEHLFPRPRLGPSLVELTRGE
ncbi:SsgA family sporulation/cell division regulator [Amycolatopsis sp. NPDC049868]|uniref:SsgA family sporulation/cell division regulator n=1 Tax=Amycolatopsis sp. NPDC049868 TaxID=3363934 RepID=UPI0037AD6C5D